MALTALDFPASPTVGQVYPDPPVTGQPQYSWNGSQWLSSKAAVTQIARTDALGWSGMQINGSMEVSQELGSTGKVGTGYVCDGWRQGVSGTMVLFAAPLTGGGFVGGLSTMLVSSTTTAQPSLGAGDYAFMQQKIEGWRIARLSWGNSAAKPITLGFWSAHNRIGTYSVIVQNEAANRTYATTYTHSVANVAQYNTVTIPGDTSGTWRGDNGVGITLIFSMGCGTTYTASSANTWLGSNYVATPGQINAVAATSDVFRITGVVVLPGIEAPTAAQSPLIMRPFDQELVTCQRYWRLITPDIRGYTAGAGYVAEYVYTLSPSMRAAATITQVAAGTSALVTSYSIVQLSVSEIRPTLVTSGVGDFFVNTRTFSVDARL